MKRAILATGLVAAVAATAPAAGAHYANPGATECGWVSYQQQTDWGYAVWARGTSCKEARRLAWDFRDRRYGVYKRYRCVRRTRVNGDADSGMAHGDIRCVRRGKPNVVVTMA